MGIGTWVFGFQVPGLKFQVWKIIKLEDGALGVGLGFQVPGLKFQVWKIIKLEDLKIRLSKN